LRKWVAIRKRSRHVMTPDAVVEFLVGNSYQSAAHLNAPATKSFYELAERAFMNSVRQLDHYKVSFQLANTLGELARRQGADVDKAITLLGLSTRHFEEAREKLPRADLPEAQSRAEVLRLEAALTINACLAAELLTDNVGYSVKGAAGAAKLMEADPGEYEDADALYSVACTLAVAARVKSLAAHRFDLDACRSQARRWLLYACARNDRWWTDGEADPDLDLLHDWMPPARRRLRESMSARDHEKPLDSHSIAALIDGVLKAMVPTRPSRNNGAPSLPRPPSPRQPRTALESDMGPIRLG
jgi:hypothetical protein